MTAARADAVITGPYSTDPRSPLLTHRHRGMEEPVHNVGHVDLVDTPAGETWAVALGVRPIDGTHTLGREVFLVPVAWTPRGPVCARARTRFTAAAPTQEAGLAVFQNQDQHATLGLTVDASGTPQVLLTAREAGAATCLAAVTVAGGEVVLAVDSDESGYAFRVEDSGTWTTLGSIERSFFSTERAGGFVGVHIGLYGTRDAGTDAAEAHVAWFDYAPGRAGSGTGQP